MPNAGVMMGWVGGGAGGNMATGASGEVKADEADADTRGCQTASSVPREAKRKRHREGLRRAQLAFQVQVVVVVVLVVAVRSLVNVYGRRHAKSYCAQATPNPPKSR